MALCHLRTTSETLLSLKDPDSGLFPVNHILEPEFHQERYVSVCTDTAAMKGAFQIGGYDGLARPPNRGTQPTYADDPDDPESLEWEGMILNDGTEVDDDEGARNVGALKSVCVRFGYMDFGTARSVSREFFEKKKNTSGVQKHDVLINSTGDGTIGRVAVFDRDFPAVVDGHITIVRFKNPEFAWFVAAYLLSSDGQKQIYRYINGSSGQVEIYPQDIERLWIKPFPSQKRKKLVGDFQKACETHYSFSRDLRSALHMIS